MKDDWPIETNHTLDQLQTTTEKIGKQHLGYSLCISQSISRDFGEYARTTTRRINELELKVSLLFTVPFFLAFSFSIAQ
jgi:hypothetical protein